jgi:hypothetical protein
VVKKEQKKSEKKVHLKVRDIVPKKDAKGGGRSGDPCMGGELRGK